MVFGYSVRSNKRSSAEQRYDDGSPLVSPGADYSPHIGVPAHQEAVMEHLHRTRQPPELTVTSPPLSAYGAPHARCTSAKGQPEFLSGVIATVNELQDIFSQLPRGLEVDIDLPQVAVIGSQSSGKSSVLEALVGRDFLPRNKDICTRLQQTQPGRSGQGTEWAEFLHKPNERFTNFADVRQEIEAETNRSVGSKWNISAQPINLKIFSPNVLSMTLIDLPGISKVPVHDQPQNIEQILIEMTRHYVENEACIILAVTPGNADIANSEAIKLSQQVDPEGTRTLGVITKADIMDDGTDVREYLLGERDPKLKLGYVAVVNRSQKDINGQVLAHKVNRLLKQHIQKLVPRLHTSLKDQQVSLRRELEDVGAHQFSTPEEGAALVRRALARFEKEFSAAITGDAPTAHTHLYGGARIANQLAMFSEHIRDSLPRLVSHTDGEIFHAIRNVYGVEGQMLMADKAFRHLLPPVVRSLRDPCQEVVGYILEELKTIATDAVKRVGIIRHFPPLGDRMEEVAGMCLESAVEPTQQLVLNLIEMEAGYINTSHPDFIGGQAAFTKAMEVLDQREKASIRDKAREKDKSNTPGRPSGEGVRGYPVSLGEDVSVPRQPKIVHADAPVLREDKLKVETTRACLESYLDVVVGNLQDSVPKAVMLLLVNHVKDDRLGEYLNTHVNRPDMIEALLQEDPQVAQTRRRCQLQLDVVTKAIRVLDRMPDKMRQSTAQMRRSVLFKE